MDTKNAWTQWHGHRGNSKWPLPKLVAKSDEANRADQNNMIKANEYLDTPEVLDAKLDIVVELIKKSQNFVAYTGAGLSKASGIPDYATKSKESIVQGPKIKSSLDALPTYAHHVLVALERAGYLKHWVQQNHDGLPQKAGYPQEKINEIHGAWFDPSNPVVQFSGSLRSDLFQWMIDWEKKADLCFCLGTSLSGMNADRMANTPAKRSLNGKALGTVLINLQQTPLDTMSAIRIWAKLDDAFKILVNKLNIQVTPIVPTIPPGDVYTIPYDEKGKKDTTCQMTLDLRDGAEIKIIAPGSMNEGSEGEIRGKRDGNYSVHLNEKGKLLSRLMGVWWVDAAIRGALDQLPLVNKKPKVVKVNAPTITETVTQAFKDIVIGTSESECVTIVQSHELIDKEKNLHQWGLELGPNAEDVVQEVIYNLHPTFRPNVIKVTEPPFSIERTGWGTFPVGVTLVLKDGQKIDAEHSLTFKKSLKVTQVPVPK